MIKLHLHFCQKSVMVEASRLACKGCLQVNDNAHNLKTCALCENYLK